MKGLVGAFISSRLLIVAGAVLLGDYFLPDVRLYGTWSILLADRQFPVGDAYWQYPPGAGALFLFSRLIGPTPVVGFILLALLADLALFVLLLVVAQRRHTSNTAVWAWIVGGLLVGPLLVSRFDVFPALFAAAAVVFAARPGVSGVFAGIGGMLKIWPLLALGAMRRRSLPLAFATASVSMLAILAIMTWWGGDGISFLGEQRDRGLQLESLGALPYLIFSDPQTVLRFGAFEIGVPGAPTVGLVISALGLILIAVFVLLRLLGRLEHVPGGDVTFALVLISIATSRVFSPQYDIWIVAVGAAALTDPRSLMRPIMWWLLGMCGLTQVIFPWAYGSLINGEPYAVALQAIRLGVLIGCTIWACSLCLQRPPRTSAALAENAANAAESA